MLGIGNELLGDDGVGVVAARRLAGQPVPGVDVVDGGTLGLMLMPYQEPPSPGAAGLRESMMRVHDAERLQISTNPAAAKRGDHRDPPNLVKP